MTTKSKKSLPKKLIVHEIDVRANISEMVIHFEHQIRENFSKWLDSLSREEVNAHINWICSEDGTDFLERNSSLVAATVFTYMKDAESRYEHDRFNDPGSELCDSLQYLLDDEIYIEE